MQERKEITCVLSMESYIAHPYWPEREKVIGIQLRSGVNRLKLEDKKLAALKSECEKQGITLADYYSFVEKAARQWYRLDNDDADSTIIIPRHQLAGSLVETIGRTPKAVHGKYNAESFRHHVRISDFTTDRTAHDEVFDRYVTEVAAQKKVDLFSVFEQTGLRAGRDYPADDSLRNVAGATILLS